jgi:type II secretory pathway pseudopilin PulG
MKTVSKRRIRGAQTGFSLVEMMVAMLITMIVMASVFTLLQKGQTSFQREPEVAEMNQNSRYGLDMVVRDLTDAGYGDDLPVLFAVVPSDGGGDTPDEVTIVFADADYPTVLPGPPYGPLQNSAVAWADPDTFTPPQDDPESAYADGDILFAIETDDCDGDGEIGIVPFELTQDPQMAGGKLKLQHNPGQSESGLNRPGGFNGEVEGDCAVFGVFRMITYRVNPLPPADGVSLERREVGIDGDNTWYPVANNIENLQVQYAVGDSDVFVDDPASPDSADPSTWITQVRVTLNGRSQSTDLQGARAGDFADGNRLRNSFTTTVLLRNITAKAAKQDNNFYN